jgi:hypothetical protein
MIGYGDNENLKEYLRLYIALHGDHEGGNASAHTARKVYPYCLQNVFLMIVQILLAQRCLTRSCPIRQRFSHLQDHFMGSFSRHLV